ncbi:MAG: phosphoribosylanthranilate isomerase [Chloroflexi bacterium]|nr:phosphoribosylanthranilate isomerase [Chloroflexota bacterium]
MTWVKICGIRSLEGARAALEAGADAVGFVFGPSRRRLSPQEAEAIIRSLADAPIAKVGVFVDEQPAAINALATALGLDYVQLSGHESPESCQGIAIPVIKAVHIRGQEDTSEAERYAEVAQILLLDSFHPTQLGGTGASFPWKLARDIVTSKPLILAGGLTPDNVAHAIRSVRPWGVDVSSGVETGGVKDLAKIRAFVKAAKDADG